MRKRSKLVHGISFTYISVVYYKIFLFAYNLQILIKKHSQIPLLSQKKKRGKKHICKTKFHTQTKRDFNYQRLSFSSKPLIIVWEWVSPQNQNQNKKSVWIFIWGLCVCVCERERERERERVFKWEWNEQPQVPSLWLRSCVSVEVSKVTK